MVAGSVVNLYLFVYLAYRSVWFPLLVAFGAVAQVLGAALWHADGRDLVIVTLVVFLGIIAVHELVFRNSLGRWALQRHARRARPV